MNNFYFVKLYKTSWLTKTYLILSWNIYLKTLTDEASTTKDGNLFHISGLKVDRVADQAHFDLPRLYQVSQSGLQLQCT